MGLLLALFSVKIILWWLNWGAVDSGDLCRYSNFFVKKLVPAEWSFCLGTGVLCGLVPWEDHPSILCSILISWGANANNKRFECFLFLHLKILCETSHGLEVGLQARSAVDLSHGPTGLPSGHCRLWLLAVFRLILT